MLAAAPHFHFIPLPHEFERFQALLNGLSKLGTIEEKKLTTDDVIAEHADVAARLQAK